MTITGFPTSSDIYLEVEGKKVAVVQSYTAKATKSSRSVEAFGESEPVATIEGQRKYTLELTRLYAGASERNRDVGGMEAIFESGFREYSRQRRVVDNRLQELAVGQAGDSFEIFTGIKPDAARMRAHLLEMLEAGL